MKYNKKEFTLKFFVNENELLFIKNHLDCINKNLKLSSKDSLFKEKSMSEFLRETILNHILNLSNYDENNVNNKINQLEKYIKRNLRLTYKSLEKQVGIEIAKEILNDIKEKED